MDGSPPRASRNCITNPHVRVPNKTKVARGEKNAQGFFHAQNFHEMAKDLSRDLTQICGARLLSQCDQHSIVEDNIPPRFRKSAASCIKTRVLPLLCAAVSPVCFRPAPAP